MESLIKSHNKIGIIIIYYGIKPLWFDYYLLTCSRNTEIDWIFFSDHFPSQNISNNIHYNQMTIGAFNALASEKLGLTIYIKNPYKICDLRPAFGIVFSDYLKLYDYWGYGDIDVMYGNFSRVLPLSEIVKYDIISTDVNFIPGHLCILKNTQIINQLFLDSPIYKTIFQSRLYYGFDEYISPIKVIQDQLLFHISKKIRLNYHLVFDYTVRNIRKTILYKLFKSIYHNKKGYVLTKNNRDFNSLAYNMHLRGLINIRYKKSYDCDLLFKKQGIKKWNIDWIDGSILNRSTNQELLYFHFIISKMNKRFHISEMKQPCNKFSISADGINN
jgi:hypothetical protein